MTLEIDINLSGRSKEAPLPLGQNFFIFMWVFFWGKIGQIVCWCPLLGLASAIWEILDPPLNIKHKHKIKLGKYSLW